MTDQNPTVSVRKGEELDIAAVDAVLKDAVAGLKGMPKVTQYSSGASNLTYAVDYPERRLVLRRPPFGTKPKSGHDMHREFKVMSALKGAIPVPETLFYTDDPACKENVVTNYANKNINYTPQEFSISAPTQSVDALSDTLVWEIQVCNETGSNSAAFDVDSLWVAAEPQQNTTIIEMNDITNPMAPAPLMESACIAACM